MPTPRSQLNVNDEWANQQAGRHGTLNRADPSACWLGDFEEERLRTWARPWCVDSRRSAGRPSFSSCTPPTTESASRYADIPFRVLGSRRTSTSVPALVKYIRREATRHPPPTVDDGEHSSHRRSRSGSSKDLSRPNRAHGPERWDVRGRAGQVG